MFVTQTPSRRCVVQDRVIRSADVDPPGVPRTDPMRPISPAPMSRAFAHCRRSVVGLPVKQAAHNAITARVRP
jgi:hypothetical protein